MEEIRAEIAKINRRGLRVRNPDRLGDTKSPFVADNNHTDKDAPLPHYFRWKLKIGETRSTSSPERRVAEVGYSVICRFHGDDFQADPMWKSAIERFERAKVVKKIFEATVKPFSVKELITEEISLRTMAGGMLIAKDLEAHAYIVAKSLRQYRILVHIFEKDERALAIWRKIELKVRSEPLDVDEKKGLQNLEAEESCQAEDVQFSSKADNLVTIKELTFKALLYYLKVSRPLKKWQCKLSKKERAITVAFIVRRAFTDAVPPVDLHGKKIWSLVKHCRKCEEEAYDDAVDMADYCSRLQQETVAKFISEKYTKEIKKCACGRNKKAPLVQPMPIHSKKTVVSVQPMHIPPQKTASVQPMPRSQKSVSKIQFEIEKQRLQHFSRHFKGWPTSTPVELKDENWRSQMLTNVRHKMLRAIIGRIVAELVPREYESVLKGIFNRATMLERKVFLETTNRAAYVDQLHKGLFSLLEGSVCVKTEPAETEGEI